MTVTQQDIIAAIEQSIAQTRSKRKKTVGLPKLREEILQKHNIREMIGLLLKACREPAPTGQNPPDNASKYWVNRHAWPSLSFGLSKTATLVRFEAIIAQYRSQTPPAPPPNTHVTLATNTPVDAAMILRMKSASRRADREIVLLGHGECMFGKWFQVPPGTTVKFYTPAKAFLRGVDIRAIAAPEVWGMYERPKVREAKFFGAWVQEHRIGQLDPSGIGHRGPANQLGGTWMHLTAQPRKLSTILQPNMGTVHFAACRCLPDNVPNSDMIAFNAGAGRNEPGPEPLPLSDTQVDVLARKGGRPTGI